MRALVTSLMVAMLTAVPMAAAAQERSDPFAHAAIERGDYADAERELLAEARVHPDRPEVLLNLAAIYARTDRSEAARLLYNRVLENEDVSLLLSPDHAANAHEIAEVGLARLDR